MSIPPKKNGLRRLSVALPLRSLLTLEKCAHSIKTDASTLARVLLEGALPALEHELLYGEVIIVEEPADPGQPPELGLSFSHMRKGFTSI